MYRHTFGTEAQNKVVAVNDMSVLANEVQFEPMWAIACPVLQYPGLEIGLDVRRNRSVKTIARPTSGEPEAVGKNIGDIVKRIISLDRLEE